MIDGTQPPDTTEQAILKKLKPEIETASTAPDPVRKWYEVVEKPDTLNLSADLFIGNNGSVNPDVFVRGKKGAFEFESWSDLGFTGDPEKRKDIKDFYTENLISARPRGSILKPTLWFEVSPDYNTFRAGIKSDDIPIGKRGSVQFEAYPVSTCKDEEGEMETQLIMRGNYNITDRISVGAMGRRFNHYGSKNPTYMAVVNGKYRLNDRIDLNAQYRNFKMNGKPTSFFFFGTSVRIR
jgi:hypothetical protein